MFHVTITFRADFGSESVRVREAATREIADEIAAEYKTWRNVKSATVKAA
jgi:hypothetical protein